MRSSSFVGVVATIRFAFPTIAMPFACYDDKTKTITFAFR